MQFELKIFLSFLIFCGFSYFYLGALQTIEIIDENCYIIKNNDFCQLKLVDDRICLSETINYFDCEKYEHIKMIPCFAKLNKYFELCKLYRTRNRVYEDYNYYDLSI